MTYKQKLILKTVVLTILSPVYVPAVILYEQRSQIADFYKEVYMILKGTHSELKDEE
jgi:hypothetical protein